MSGNKSGELLSAYYDGETSPEEFAVVEPLLETSSEARRELDEIGALAKLLNTLPHQTAPVELAPSILSRGERESLLPALADSTNSTQSSSRPSKNLRRETGLLGVAAALLLVVFLANRLDPEQTDSTIIAQNSNIEQVDESVEHNAAIANTEADLADLSTTERKLVNAIGSSQTLSATESHNEIRSFGKSALNESRLRAVQIGDVIPYFAVAQNRVAVLEVTVIDVQKAVGTIQLLLEGNQIPKISETTADGITQGVLITNNTLKPVDQTQITIDGLFAIYIESSESQLSEAMEQIRREGILADLKLIPPVELSQVKLADSHSVTEGNRSKQHKQEQTAGSLADAVLQGRSQRIKSTVPSAKFTSGNRQPKLSPKKQSIEDGNRIAGDLKSSSGKRSGESGNAFQMLVTVLPRSLIENSSGKPDEKMQQAAEAVTKSKPAATKTRLQANSVADSSLTNDTTVAPIRVILVFQSQPPAEAVKPK